MSWFDDDFARRSIDSEHNYLSVPNHDRSRLAAARNEYDGTWLVSLHEGRSVKSQTFYEDTDEIVAVMYRWAHQGIGEEQ